jgi:hypothetical protein
MKYNFRRINDNVREGTILFENGKYMISDSGISRKLDIECNFTERFNQSIKNFINCGFFKTNGDLKTLEVSPLLNRIINEKIPDANTVDVTEFKFSTYDISIFNRAMDNIININDCIDDLKNKNKKLSEFNRQTGMFLGRLKKLDAMGYVQKIDENYIITDRFCDAYTKYENDRRSSIKEKDHHKYGLGKYKLTNYDYKEIVTPAKDKIWSADNYKNYCKEKGIDDKLAQAKSDSILKRMEALQEMGFAKEISDGEYGLDDYLFERKELYNKKGLDRCTEKQKQILHDLKDFLNISSEQLESYIYDNSFICNMEVKELLNMKLIDQVNIDINNDGYNTNVFYLTTKGKKELCHNYGYDIKDIFKSKVLTRPEEIGHDLLVYSSFLKIKETLKENDITITSIMTDKQMRSFDMKNHNKQRIEYSDLYVEYKNSQGDTGSLNIEVDCGYRPSIIKSKSDNIDNLIWVTNSANQQALISKHAGIEREEIMLIPF